MTGQVSVGVLVYNNGATLRRAVESLINQTCPPDFIHISDDASIDDSEQIGRQLEAEYSCVRYTRQTANLGSSGNFRFLLHAASAPYFMWLAADDYLMPPYIEQALACLTARPDVTTCVSKVRFIDHEKAEALAEGTYPLLYYIKTNLAHYLSAPKDNSRLFGLHRRDVLLKAFPPCHFHAFDYAAMAGTLLFGKHAELQDILIVREKTPIVEYVRQVQKDNNGPFSNIFPLLPMTADLLHRQKIPLSPRILMSLFKINLIHHAQYSRVYYPVYYFVFGPLFWLAVNFVRSLEYILEKSRVFL